MLGLIAVLIPILVTDIINPVLFAAIIFGLGSRQPYLNATLMLLGWFVTYFVVGIVLALGLESIADFLNNPRPVDFYIETVVALLLIWLAVRVMRSGERQKKKPELDDADALSPLGSFGLGASINLIGMPFAIPYFAAIDQILKAELRWFPSSVALFIYNLLYVLPFAVVIGLRRIYGTNSDALFNKINHFFERISLVLMPALLLLIAGALLTDAIYYFATGKPLF